MAFVIIAVFVLGSAVEAKTGWSAKTGAWIKDRANALRGR